MCFNNLKSQVINFEILFPDILDVATIYLILEISCFVILW